MQCRLQQALQSEAPERAVEATGLLLDLAERLLNAFAAAISYTNPSDAVAMQSLVSQYGAARQDILQDALNGSIAVCTRGMTPHHALKRSPHGHLAESIRVPHMPGRDPLRQSAITEQVW